jgi:hypothetical protein
VSFGEVNSAACRWPCVRTDGVDAQLATCASIQRKPAAGRAVISEDVRHDVVRAR